MLFDVNKKIENAAKDIKDSKNNLINDKIFNQKSKINNKLPNRISSHGLCHNIGIDYMFRFISNFNLTGALWVLYLSYRGMSLGQIGLLEGFFHITFTALLYPISSNALNELIPSEQRATIISVSSMMFSAAMIIIFPICGFAGDFIGLEKVFYIVGVLIIIFQIWFMGRVKVDTKHWK
ncbi:MAG: hypothetical protein WCD89_26815 [Anaerocolumna sp.]